MNPVPLNLCGNPKSDVEQAINREAERKYLGVLRAEINGQEGGPLYEENGNQGKRKACPPHRSEKCDDTRHREA